MKMAPGLLIQISSLVFLISVSLGAELPPEAKRLVEQRDEAIQKIDSKFCEELEKIKLAYTKRGDLDSANAVADLIGKVDSKPQAHREGVIEGVWKRDLDDSIWTFDKDGKGGVVFGNVRFTVDYQAEKKIFFLRSARWTNIVSYGADLRTLEGTADGGKTYRMRRIK